MRARTGKRACLWVTRITGPAQCVIADQRLFPLICHESWARGPSLVADCDGSSWSARLAAFIRPCQCTVQRQLTAGPADSLAGEVRVRPAATGWSGYSGPVTSSTQVPSPAPPPPLPRPAIRSEPAPPRDAFLSQPQHIWPKTARWQGIVAQTRALAGSRVCGARYVRQKPRITILDVNQHPR